MCINIQLVPSLSSIQDIQINKYKHQINTLHIEHFLKHVAKINFIRKICQPHCVKQTNISHSYLLSHSLSLSIFHCHFSSSSFLTLTQGAASDKGTTAVAATNNHFFKSRDWAQHSSWLLPSFEGGKRLTSTLIYVRVKNKTTWRKWTKWQKIIPYLRCFIVLTTTKA